jgi:cellulose synthase/poly-beta-1,6-N-acetylglucosamine synthase-like glycosyltransferase
MSILIVLLSLGLLLWLGALAWTLRNAGGILQLEAAREFPLDKHPRVSILIPARNEAAILEKSLPRFLEQDYDNYEVILVDDGSTDGTPQLAEKFLRRYPERLRVIRVDGREAVGTGEHLCLRRMRSFLGKADAAGIQLVAGERLSIPQNQRFALFRGGGLGRLHSDAPANVGRVGRL